MAVRINAVDAATASWVDQLREKYVNTDVDNAENPSKFGYHHGPIKNPNHGWVPPSHQEDAKIVGRKRSIETLSVAENALAEKEGVQLSSVNGLICDIVVDPSTGEMCGAGWFGDCPALRRHIRTAHPGAVANFVSHGSLSDERVAAEIALRKWVRDGHWRKAKYSKEPGIPPFVSIIRMIADELELLARYDASVAQKYGIWFHRYVPGREQGSPGRLLFIQKALPPAQMPKKTPQSGEKRKADDADVGGENERRRSFVKSVKSRCESSSHTSVVMPAATATATPAVTPAVTPGSNVSPSTTVQRWSKTSLVQFFENSGLSQEAYVDLLALKVASNLRAEFALLSYEVGKLKQEVKELKDKLSK